MSDIRVVPFEAKHAPGVVAVILPIQQAEFGLPITLEAQPDLEDVESFYRRGCGNFWVALDGDEIVGTIGMLDVGAARVALRKMFVKASHRGAERAVARRLLQTVLEWARANDVAEIFLGTTAKFLAAHRFYEKHGFTEITRGELPASFPVMSVDTKFYRMNVSREEVV